jgi:hypothetical protein
MIRQPWKPPPESCQQDQSMQSNPDLNVKRAGAPDREQPAETVVKKDLEIDDIISTFATTSLGLIPPSVTRKQKKRESAAHMGQVANSADSVNREIMRKS